VRWFSDGYRMLYTAWQGVTQQIGILDETTGTITPPTKDFFMESGGGPISRQQPDLQHFATQHSNEQHPPDICFG